MRRIGIVFLGVTLLLGARPDSAVAQAAVSTGIELPVLKHELPNGLRILVLPRHTAPTVSLVVRFGLGGVNEEPGSTGIAHFLEHLLFKGTSTLGTVDIEAERVLFARMDALQDSIRLLQAEGATDAATAPLLHRIETLESDAAQYVVSNEIDRILSTNGARGLNASTDNEATTYYVELPANRIELWFLLESKRMRDPVFREFYSERRVVAEERRLRVETSPAGLLYETHLEESFALHPYGRPVVGYMADIERHGRERVRQYYDRYYGPNNAVVAIVGDVDPFEVVRWADSYFGDLPAGETPPPIEVTEPPQGEERRRQIILDAEPQVRIGWHIPEEAHPDTPALSVLAALLTGGRTAQLHERLVLSDRIATRVGASLGPGVRFPRLFTIDAHTLFPHTTLEIEAAIYAELDSLRARPPSEAELQRIRNQLEAGSVRSLTSHLGLAFQLAESESVYDDWRTAFTLRERLSGVQPEDVTQVVRKYFTPSNRTVVSIGRKPPRSAR